MIPQSRIPTTPHHPLAPILPNAFLYPSFLLLLLTRKNPGNLSKPRNSGRLPGLILSSQACEISIPFLYRPDFSKSSLFLPSLVRTSSFCLLTQNRYGVPVPAPAPAQNRCRSYKRRLFQSLPLAVPHGSSFFRSPHPPDHRRTVNGLFLRPRFPSALCLLQPSAGMPPLSPPFLCSKRPGFPDRTLQPAKAPHPFLTAWKPFHSSPKSQLFLFSPAKLRKT